MCVKTLLNYNSTLKGFTHITHSNIVITYVNTLFACVNTYWKCENFYYMYEIYAKFK